MSRAERLLELMQVLRQYRHPVGGAVLAAELGISIRTLYRDIASLQARGATIDGAPGLGYVLRAGFVVPPLYCRNLTVWGRRIKFIEPPHVPSSTAPAALAMVQPGTRSGLLSGDVVADPNFVILYVDNPGASATFYADLLGRPPLEASPTFAMFSLHGDVMPDLWSKNTVAPEPEGGGGGAELALTVASAAAVDATHRAWRAKGIPVVQGPTDLDSGRTFVGLDPDHHRLRVFAPAMG